MAFSDLISKDVAAPLAGFDKAVATGFELAQNQQKLGMAQQQIQLEQERVTQSYLDKAANLVPSLLRANGKARAVFGQAYSNMMAKAGMPVNQESLDAYLSISGEQENPAQTWEYLLKKHKGDRQSALLEFSTILGASPADLPDMMARFETQRMADERSARHEAAVLGRMREAREYKVEDLTKKEVSRILEKSPGQFDKLATNLNYISGVLNAPSPSVSDIRGLKPHVAKTIGGAVGNLTENEQADAIPQGLESEIQRLTSWVETNPNKPAPAEIVNALRVRVNQYVENLVISGSKKMFDDAFSAKKNPDFREGFKIQQEGGSIVLGYGMKQVIDRYNSMLRQVNIQNRSGIRDLQMIPQKSAAPMTEAQLESALRDAINKKLIIRY